MGKSPVPLPPHTPHLPMRACKLVNKINYNIREHDVTRTGKQTNAVPVEGTCCVLLQTEVTAARHSVRLHVRTKLHCVTSQNTRKSKYFCHKHLNSSLTRLIDGTNKENKHSNAESCVTLTSQFQGHTI
jgi:hypothetical protein